SLIYFLTSRRPHTRFKCDWSSDVCSSDLSVSSIIALQTACGSFPRQNSTTPGCAVASRGQTRPDAECFYPGRSEPLVGGRSLREIGRASCRERGERAGVARGVRREGRWVV